MVPLEERYCCRRSNSLLIGVGLPRSLRNSLPPEAQRCGGPTLLFIWLGTVAVLVIPWKELGFIPTEIAGVKFERIANAQKQEQIAAIVPLQEELKDLAAKYESIVNALAASSPGLVEEHKQSNTKELDTASIDPNETTGFDKTLDHSTELNALLLQFFRKYRGSFFSPVRIQHWGSSRTGFAALGNFSTDEIRQALFKGVDDKAIDTMVNGKGNTLYGLSKRSGRG